MTFVKIGRSISGLNLNFPSNAHVKMSKCYFHISDLNPPEKAMFGQQRNDWNQSFDTHSQWNQKEEEPVLDLFERRPPQEHQSLFERVSRPETQDLFERRRSPER